MRSLRLGTIFLGCLARSDTQEKCSRVAATAFRPSLTAIPTVPVQLGFTPPFKIHIVLIVQIHSNEHEFLVIECLCPSAPAGKNYRYFGVPVEWTETVSRQAYSVRPPVYSIVYDEN